jgi:hypothetical protein
VKCVNRLDAEHLMTTLQHLYTGSEDWTGTCYCDLTLTWDYANGTVDLSIPGYIAHALKRFEHQSPLIAQHAPHAWLKPTYGGAKQHLTPPLCDESPARWTLPTISNGCRKS